MMTDEQFWTIIEQACGSDVRSADEWDGRLTEMLVQLPADDIVEWNHIFDRLAAQAYRTDLWAAAYLINGGASDDGFYYFRCWLIGMGRRVYESAIKHPDNLADVVSPAWILEGIGAEAEIYGAAHAAWMAVTGKSDTDHYPARNEEAELIGEEWDFDDPNQMRQHLPRLAALYEE
jgi:hypothetical protein